MKSSIITIALLIGFSTLTSIAQADFFNYFGQIPPGDIPEIFAENIISVSDRYEYGLSISPKGNEIYFTAEDPGDGLMRIVKEGNVWSSPQKANLRKSNAWEFEAFYTQTGDSLFFTSDNQIYFVTDSEAGWSEATKLNSPVNNDDVMWSSFAANGNLYYTKVSDFCSYRSKLVNGVYQGGVKIADGAHPYVSRDESYFLYNKSGDLFICFKSSSGEGWNAPKKLGEDINTSYGETCPSISPDEKFMFFSRYNEAGGKSDIYWVSTGFIDELRNPTPIHEIESEDVIIYPNPANETIQINTLILGDKPIKCQLIDINGKLVLDTQLSSNTLDVSGYDKGNYILRINSGVESYSSQIIIK